MSTTLGFLKGELVPYFVFLKQDYNLSTGTLVENDMYQLDILLDFNTEYIPRLRCYANQSDILDCYYGIISPYDFYKDRQFDYVLENKSIQKLTYTQAVEKGYLLPDTNYFNI